MLKLLDRRLPSNTQDSLREPQGISLGDFPSWSVDSRQEHIRVLRGWGAGALCPQDRTCTLEFSACLPASLPPPRIFGGLLSSELTETESSRRAAGPGAPGFQRPWYQKHTPALLPPSRSCPHPGISSLPGIPGLDPLHYLGHRRQSGTRPLSCKSRSPRGRMFTQKRKGFGGGALPGLGRKRGNRPNPLHSAGPKGTGALGRMSFYSNENRGHVSNPVNWSAARQRAPEGSGCTITGSALTSSCLCRQPPWDPSAF